MNDNKDFFMPAEWEEHERTFIEWPVKEAMVWSENYLDLCTGYSEVARKIASYEPVTMIVNEETQIEAQRFCGKSVETLVVSHNDAWIRDNGPTFVVANDKRIKGVNWKFNAWGEKYLPYDLDDAVAPKILEHYNVPRINVPIVLEGGSIHVDGEGTLITTEECLLNPNRNPDLTRGEIEEHVKKNLNISKIIWLKRGLFGDETDGHIDNIACFARPGLVLIQTCQDVQDPNYEITKECLEILKNSTDAKGRKLEIIEIPQPPIRFYKDIRLTLSYINFYFINKSLILPIFGGDAEETDKQAEAILQRVFPDRTIEKVYSMSLIKEGGNVHCITQQMPRV
nr:agmatine deiminase family protein [Alkalibaculum sporogenes]